jgi:hypothetical protein
MKLVVRPATSLLCLAVFALTTGCGDAPQKLGPADVVGGHSADDGHDHSAHAPNAAPSWTGTIVLEGELAELQDGYIFVSLRLQGQSMPFMSYKIALADYPPVAGSERRVPFELSDRTNQMPGGAPPELADSQLEIAARFDPDGIVDTKEGAVTVATPVGWGGSGLEIVFGG